ncbi:hypothetical protein [Chromobacterium sp. IIBBL 290-4]|uniref:hypothetical protein n=1 Tax=Chromobacterium sp. IIBBL 290-4 TaxID=2953890 RepID=UPI0020B8F2A6|nr:hypothetical protein [Chromobacterium sp. IIBBL 290-4]UTH73592.1 hypothetical protein NKT35_18925 [Chromobacterium sp. IIBBL 290-4]
MDDLLEQIQNANFNGSYYLALFSSLTIPDICAALESEDGQANKNRYTEWFDRWISPKYRINDEVSLSGATCYSYRCSMLHQARSSHPKMRYDKVFFVEPGLGASFHNNVMEYRIGEEIIRGLNIDVRVFCTGIVSGARDWIQSVSDSEIYKKI